MAEDPLWVDVSALMVAGQAGSKALIEKLGERPEIGVKAMKYASRISRLLGILDIDMHVEEVTDEDKTLDFVVDIFNKVNSGGTKLSKGDLALAKVCADWPEARNEMKTRLRAWQTAGFDFNLDWLLRSVNTVLTGDIRALSASPERPEPAALTGRPGASSPRPDARERKAASCCDERDRGAGSRDQRNLTSKPNEWHEL